MLLSIIASVGLRPGNGDNNLQRNGGGKWEANLDPIGYCWLHGCKVKLGHNSATCNKQLEGHEENATCANTLGGKENTKDWKPQTCQCKPAGDRYDKHKLITVDCCSMVHSIPTPGCNNPDNLNTTAVDTGANISLLNMNAQAKRLQQQTPLKSIIQPKGPMLTTTENLVLLLNKLSTNAGVQNPRHQK
jgi:hypothetical protein